MKATIHALSAVCLLAALSGCASKSPRLDREFGMAVKAVTTEQILNPGAPVTGAVATLDGKAARAAYDNYQKSFKDPQPQTGALSIGVGR